MLRRCSLLANYEEKAEIPRPAGKQALGRFDHGRDDAFGVAGTAAPDVGFVLARGGEGGTVSMWVDRVTTGSPQ